MYFKRCILSILLLVLLKTNGFFFSDFRNYSTLRASESGNQVSEIYVSAESNNLSGSGTQNNPYRTIQKAINNSENGSTIIVLPGYYTGTGNTNLNLQGKSIEIKSIDPTNIYYVKNTIIDAAGVGLIAKFTNNEKHVTILNGFTLGVGDTTINITKGIPGFFEFSEKAIPTIKNVKILGATLREVSKTHANVLTQTVSVDKIINPYFHPVQTTDFYGSGDANKDELINASDITFLNQIIDGQKPKNIRSDVNGDGFINSNDATLLQNHIENNELLPSSWNYLNANQKNDWITKTIQLDKTNENTYYYYFFQCGNFSTQFYTHFNYLYPSVESGGNYPFNVVYNGGPTIYNIPTYQISVIAPGFGHSINAILVGDNPLNFDHWRFIEPQNDNTISPGDWNMPYNSELTFYYFDNPSPSICNLVPFISFQVNQDTVTSSNISPNLITVRPETTGDLTGNSSFQSNPQIIISDSTYILFQKPREDMSRRTDIHINNLSTQKEKAISLFEENSLLLDYTVESDTIIHLLFTSKLNKKPGVYYGKYNLKNNILTNSARISSPDNRVVSSGKLLVSNSEIYAFWFVNPFSSLAPSSGGIYWTRKPKEANWESEAFLFPIPTIIPSISSLGPNLFPYIMDGVILNNNYPLLTIQSHDSYEETDIVFFKFDGTAWTSNRLNEPLAYDGAMRELSLQYDRNNTLHLVFANPAKWNDHAPALCYINSSDNGVTWSAVRNIETSESYERRVYCSPQLICDSNKLHLTYLNREFPSQIFWRTFENNVWHNSNSFTLPVDNFPDSPQIALTRSHNLFFAWANSFENKYDVKTKIIDIGGIEVTGISVSPVLLEFTVGDLPDTIKATIFPNNASNKSLKWSSGNPNIATVNTSGIVTPISEGISVISATTLDGNKVANCSVTVHPSSSLVIEAEEFARTNGIFNDNFVPYGVNKQENIGINWVNSGDWVEYDIHLAYTGKYEIEYMISSPSDNAKIQLIVDSLNISTDDVTNNGYWDNYESLKILNYVNLSSGSHIIRLVATGSNDWQWNLDKFSLSLLDSTNHQSSPETEINVTDIIVSPTTLQLETESTPYLLSSSVLPNNASNKTIIWSSSNEEVASVNSAGNVTAIATGSALISASSEDGNKTSTCTVIVTNQANLLTIEAESYKRTGGIYNDGYVPFGVNLQDNIGINWVNNADWAEYSVDISTPGEYEIEYYISSPSSNAQIQFLANDSVISTDNVVNNGEWENYQTLTAENNVNLNPGINTIKLLASGTNTWQWNLDKIILTRIGIYKNTNNEDEFEPFINKPDNISIYPNPTYGEISVFRISRNSCIEIYNLQGKILKRIFSDGNSATIDLSSIQPGSYILKVKSSALEQLCKIVIKR